ncbi:Hypothetical predicted protein, partial [Pelobates cultripes]
KQQSYRHQAPHREAHTAPEVQYNPEISEDSNEDEESLTSPCQGGVYQSSESDICSSPSTKVDIKKLQVDLRLVWKSDLLKAQAEIRAVHKKVQEVEAIEASRDQQFRVTQ